MKKAKQGPSGSPSVLEIDMTPLYKLNVRAVMGIALHVMMGAPALTVAAMLLDQKLADQTQLNGLSGRILLLNVFH
uniref:Uncharacterized protein n=1 Tax=Peronospora matthiolae TaxID=2874970 RepID=A0AAV1T6D8_9STRA